MGESLTKSIVWAENTVALTRQELAEVSQKGPYTEVERVAGRLGDELNALARLRERQAAKSFRDLGKEVAGHLLRMAKAERPAARAIAAIEPTKENEEADHAARFN